MTEQTDTLVLFNKLLTDQFEMNKQWIEQLSEENFNLREEAAELDIEVHLLYDQLSENRKVVILVS